MPLSRRKMRNGITRLNESRFLYEVTVMSVDDSDLLFGDQHPSKVFPVFTLKGGESGFRKGLSGLSCELLQYHHCRRNINRINSNRQSVEKCIALYGVLDTLLLAY